MLFISQHEYTKIVLSSHIWVSHWNDKTFILHLLQWSNEWLCALYVYDFSSVSSRPLPYVTISVHISCLQYFAKRSWIPLDGLIGSFLTKLFFPLPRSQQNLVLTPFTQWHKPFHHFCFIGNSKIPKFMSILKYNVCLMLRVMYRAPSTKHVTSSNKWHKPHVILEIFMSSA